MPQGNNGWQTVDPTGWQPVASAPGWEQIAPAPAAPNPNADPTAAVNQAIASIPRPSSALPEPPATIGPAPTGVGAWLGNAENDLLHGNQSTIIGKTLHTLGANPNGLAGGAFGAEKTDPNVLKQATKTALIGAGTMLAPELLAPEAAPVGGSLLARAVPWIARAATSGLGAGVGTVAGQALTGENPVAKPQLKETGENAGLAGGTDLLLGALPFLAGTKGARGMVNASLGASARDVYYGNPAKALLNEGIKTPITGDIELYKEALRAGAQPSDALVAAGGRVGAVSKQINELMPRLNAALGNAKGTIPVAQVIDKPLNDAAMSIITNRAMTAAEQDAAINQIGALQQALKEGLPKNISPLEANQIKQLIGDRVNWTGNAAVGDEVKPAYKAVYGALKNAVNRAVPQSAGLNERLSDLLAAQGDLKKLMGLEEVGYGKGAMGSAVTGIARRLEAVAGRAIPGIAGLGRLGQQVLPSAIAAAPKPLPTPALLRGNNGR